MAKSRCKSKPSHLPSNGVRSFLPEAIVSHAASQTNGSSRTNGRSNIETKSTVSRTPDKLTSQVEKRAKDSVYNEFSMSRLDMPLNSMMMHKGKSTPNIFHESPITTRAVFTSPSPLPLYSTTPNSPYPPTSSSPLSSPPPLLFDTQAAAPVPSRTVNADHHRKRVSPSAPQ